MQLPGQPCGTCGRPISGRREGDFCPNCGVPVHDNCRPASPAGGGRCPECGSPPAAAREWQGRHERAALKASQADSVSRFRHGWEMVLYGLAYTLFAPFVCCMGQPQVWVVAPGMIWVGLLHMIRGRRNFRGAQGELDESEARDG